MQRDLRMPQRDDILRPRFRRWMRRANPALAAEDANALFQAMREHRRRVRADWVRRGRLVPHIPGIWPWVAPGFLVVLAVLLLGAASVCLLPVAVGIGIALTYAWPRGISRGRSRMPLRLGDAFLPGDVSGPLALDLWMSAVSPREIAEALYLDLCDAWRVRARFLVVIAALGIAAWYTPREDFDALDATAFYGSLAFAAVNFHGLIVVVGFEWVRVIGLETRFDGWRAVSRRTALVLAMQRVMGLFWRILLAFAVVVLAGYATAILLDYQRRAGWMAAGARWSSEWLLLQQGLLFWFLKAAFSPLPLQSVESSLDRGEEAFAALVGERIEHDPDAMAYSDEVAHRRALGLGKANAGTEKVSVPARDRIQPGGPAQP